LYRHDADVISDFNSKEITHVVTDRADWDQSLKSMRRNNAQIVRSSWVWQTINEEKKVRERDHFMQ
jgi:hypothetical protein